MSKNAATTGAGGGSSNKFGTNEAADYPPRKHTPLDDNRFWFAAVANLSNDAIAAIDVCGLVTLWNGAAESMFGFAYDEMIGQPINGIIPSDRIDEEASILDRVRAGTSNVRLESKRLCKDGKTIPIRVTFSPIRDDHNRIIGVSETAEALSGAGGTNGDLLHREELLASVLEIVPDALVVCDQYGIIRSFSDSAESLFGYGRREVMGQNVSVLMPPPYRDRHDSYMERYLSTGERRVMGVSRTVVGLRKDGSTFPMEFSVGGANLLGARLFIGFVHDLTEREGYTQALLDRNRCSMPQLCRRPCLCAL